jgi:hypothetical protein
MSDRYMCRISLSQSTTSRKPSTATCCRRNRPGDCVNSGEPELNGEKVICWKKPSFWSVMGSDELVFTLDGIGGLVQQAVGWLSGMPSVVCLVAQPSIDYHILTLRVDRAPSRFVTGFHVSPSHRLSGKGRANRRYIVDRACEGTPSMANDSRTCSISHQDCATLYTFPGSSIPFTNTSCVPYTPWLSGDVGVCGWVGAPCETAGTGSNCSECFPSMSSRPYGSLWARARSTQSRRLHRWCVWVSIQPNLDFDVSSNRFDSGGLGERCPDLGFCNGEPHEASGRCPLI